jgi:glycosyltransferase involved in cell wall biosynthesis
MGQRGRGARCSIPMVIGASLAGPGAVPARASPQVTVIIATYNRSGALRYAISSVLAQTYRDFELLVVGDACTDDSASVAAEFADPRVRWHNLSTNCGNQFGPNNHGLGQARGRYIAYLAHDDLWHRDHLATLVAAIEAHEADLVFSLTLEIGPPEKPTRHVIGLCPDGVYHWSIWAPPSAWLHRHDVVGRMGAWRDYQSMVVPTDVEFLARAFEQHMHIVPVAELTTFKLTSVQRTKAYLDRAGDEQKEWWGRLQREDDLRYREMLAVLADYARRHLDSTSRFVLPSRSTSGSLVDAFRVRRGLPPAPRRPGVQVAPLFTDRAALRFLNSDGDIAPAQDRNALHGSGDVPADGLFVGLNWHSLEMDLEGRKWRWMDRNAEIVVTRPTGRSRRLAVELAPGPGFAGREARLVLRDANGEIIAGMPINEGGTFAFDVPLPAGAGATFFLDAEGGGSLIPGDPRVLNFRVFGLNWAD